VRFAGPTRLSATAFIPMRSRRKDGRAGVQQNRRSRHTRHPRAKAPFKVGSDRGESHPRAKVDACFAPPIGARKHHTWDWRATSAPR
jgi:hypothetical protein